jgi:hypothetical protein
MPVTVDSGAGVADETVVEVGSVTGVAVGWLLPPLPLSGPLPLPFPPAFDCGAEVVTAGTVGCATEGTGVEVDSVTGAAVGDGRLSLPRLLPPAFERAGCVVGVTEAFSELPGTEAAGDGAGVAVTAGGC